MKIGILAIVGAALAASSAMAQVGPIVNNVPAAWVDISWSGVDLNLGEEGNTTITTTIGNRVFPAGIVRVFASGGMSFVSPFSGFQWANQPIPEPTGTPHYLSGGTKYLLPYWDDLDNRPRIGFPRPDNSDVYWQEIEDLLIIQWNNVGHFPASVDRATFQVQIPREGTHNGVLMRFLYEEIENPSFMGGASATIGYVAGRTGDNFGHNDQWSFNTAGAVSNGTVLTILSSTECPCDWNASGAVNSQDFFDFLNEFFANDADYNNSGETNSQDFFDFLGCFFAGC